MKKNKIEIQELLIQYLKNKVYWTDGIANSKRISKTEDKSTDIFKTKQREEKTEEKLCHGDLSDNINKSTISVTGSTRRG